MSTPATSQDAVEVLSAHTLNPPAMSATCRCGWDGEEIHHVDHLAEQLADAGLLDDTEGFGEMSDQLDAAQTELDVLRPGIQALLAKAEEADQVAAAGGATRGVLTTTTIRNMLAGATR
jgi:hypothetical protein